MMVLTGKDVEKARVLALRQMLKLEIKGLTRHGKSAYQIVKDEFGFKGSKQKVLDQLSAYISENILFDKKECPQCGEEINPAAMMAKGCSEKKRQALIKNAKKPRPNRKKNVKRLEDGTTEETKTVTIAGIKTKMVIRSGGDDG